MHIQCSLQVDINSSWRGSLPDIRHVLQQTDAVQRSDAETQAGVEQAQSVNPEDRGSDSSPQSLDVALTSGTIASFLKR